MTPAQLNRLQILEVQEASSQQLFKTVNRNNQKQINSAMQSYPKLMLLFVQSEHPPNTVKPLADLGLKQLDTILYKITVHKMRNISLYEQLSRNQQDTFSEITTVFDFDYLLMCLGDIVVKGHYDRIANVEPEIEQCVRRKAESLNISNIRSGYVNNSILDKTKENSYETSFTGIHAMFRNPEEKSFNSKGLEKANNNISLIKQKYQQQQQPIQNDFLKQLSFIPIRSSSANNNANATLYMNKNNSKTQSSYSLNNSSSIWQIEPMDVQMYLNQQVNNHSSQINLLKQKFKLGQGQWESETQLQKGIVIYIQSIYYIIPASRTLQGQVRIHGKGKATNKKDAKQDASKNILRQIYQQFPNIFDEFRAIKKRQNISA